MLILILVSKNFRTLKFAFELHKLTVFKFAKFSKLV